LAKRTSAYSQILKEKQDAATEDNQEQQKETTAAQSGTTVKPQNTVKSSKTALAKISIYPTQEQLDKLYDLMEAFRKKTGVKINQQDMIRRLIDLAEIDSILP
jgi:hypothetical protein